MPSHLASSQLVAWMWPPQDWCLSPMMVGVQGFDKGTFDSVALPQGSSPQAKFALSPSALSTCRMSSCRKRCTGLRDPFHSRLLHWLLVHVIDHAHASDVDLDAGARALLLTLAATLLLGGCTGALALLLTMLTCTGCWSADALTGCGCYCNDWVVCWSANALTGC